MNFIDDAYERLSKTAPDLIKYISTFVELTDDVPENYGVELGVFMLISGQSMFYVPVVAKGGTVFPIDSVFSSEDSQFFPLTPKFVDKVINSSEMSLGEKAAIPGNVIKNPNVRELIEPPKTGKFAYASTGLSEFLYQLSEPAKAAFLEKLASDKGFAKGLHKLGFEIEDMKEVLTKPIEKKASHTSIELPVRVVTGGDNLSDEAIQGIIKKGYAIEGIQHNPTFCIEYDARNDGYTKLGAAQEGEVYEVIFKDGSSKTGFVPHMAGNLQSTGDDYATNERINQATIMGSVKVGANRTVGKQLPIIFEDGTHACGGDPVIRATALGKMEDVILHLAAQGLFHKLEEAPTSFSRFMLVTKNGWMGPYETDGRPVVRSATGLTIQLRAPDGDHLSIHQSPNIHGDLTIKGRDVYVNESAVLLKLGNYVNSETEIDVAAASIKRSHMIVNLLAPVRIGYDGVEYSVNGKTVGQEADIARELVERKGLSKQAFEMFITKVQETKSLDIYMSKEAAMGAGPDYQSLPPNMPGSQMTPPHDNDPAVPSVSKGYQNSGVNGYGSTMQNIKASLGTGDKSIVESTIISEFINDPNMFETIGTYLPVIKESVDKLGRSIFLVRLNINNLSASIEPEYLSNLMSSLRNTYKMLGDTYMRLDTLTNTSMVEEGEL